MGTNTVEIPGGNGVHTHMARALSHQLRLNSSKLLCPSDFWQVGDAFPVWPEVTDFARLAPYCSVQAAQSNSRLQ